MLAAITPPSFGRGVVKVDEPDPSEIRGAAPVPWADCRPQTPTARHLFNKCLINQYALNVQYAPDAAIPIQVIVGSSNAAACAGEAIHMAPGNPPPMAEFCRRAGPMTKWPRP